MISSCSSLSPWAASSTEGKGGLAVPGSLALKARRLLMSRARKLAMVNTFVKG
jgi:hypothetical protein